MNENEDNFFDFEEENEFKELLSKFENYLDKDEHHFFDLDNIIDLIDYYKRWEETTKAKQALNLGLKYYPNASILILKKAEILALQNRTHEAIKILNQIEQHIQTDVHFYLTRGDIYSQMGLHDTAINEYEKALNIDTEKNDWIYYLIGSEYRQQNKFHESIHYLKKSIALNPRRVICFSAIYLIYSHLDKQEECIKYLQKIIDEDPFNDTAWTYLSHCYEDLNDYENALEAINFALSIDQQNELIALKKAKILMKLKKYNEAITTLKELPNDASTEISVLPMLAEIYFELSDYENAVYYFRKTIELEPKYSEVWVGLAYTYIRLLQDNEALFCVQQVVANAEDNPEILLDAGKLYLELDLYEEALEVLKYAQKQIKEEDEKTELFVWLSIALEKAGYVSEAVELLSNQIYNQQKQDADLYYCLAGLLLLYQYRQEGLHLLEKALRIDPAMYEIIYEFSRFFEDDFEIQSLLQQYTKI